jgi:hypothetical protein
MTVLTNYKDNECVSCFFVWRNETGIPETFCEYCKHYSKSYYPPERKLERTLSILENTYASRLPEILRRMYTVLKTSDSSDE